MSKNLSEQFTSINFWSWIRILIVVLLFIGAYAWWVVEWLKSSPRPNFDRQKLNQEYPREYRRNGMQQMWPMQHSASDMSMYEMEKMLQGKTGDELDRAFLEAMIPHHQGAIDMAKYLTWAKHDELKKLWADIIAAQANEIAEMQAWQKAWGYSSTGNTATGMMMDHSMMMHN